MTSFLILDDQFTLDDQFAKLQKASEKLQNSHPKIQKVPSYLRNRKEFCRYYSPKFVSIGPIHYGNDENLQLGEQYKLMWAAKYSDSTGLTAQNLHKRIADNIEELKNLFADDVLSRFDHHDKQLSWLLFVDGCALLHIMEKAEQNKPGQLNLKVSQLVQLVVDVFLLENQLPYAILKMLWKDENEIDLVETMRKFLYCCHWCKFDRKQPRGIRRRQHHDHDEDNRIQIDDQQCIFGNEPPTHLLDVERRIALFDSPYIKTINYDGEQIDLESNMRVTYRNIQELNTAGIKLKSSKTHWLSDISFSHGWLFGTLTLPEIVVDDTVYSTILNLIAYEMCPDFENNHGICSFVAFMDSLIDHPDDVKTLRSKKIFFNSVGSDEEVARLFNIISTDSVQNILVYASVRAEIEKHYRNRFKTWIALAFHTYFSNPWAIIAFIAAIFALALTSVQTWFAIYPAQGPPK